MLKHLIYWRIFQIAAEIAAPLAKTEEIVLISGNDSTTADVARLVAQLPPAIAALSGVDLSKVLGEFFLNIFF